MKRILVLMLVAIMLLSTAACSIPEQTTEAPVAAATDAPAVTDQVETTDVPAEKQKFVALSVPSVNFEYIVWLSGELQKACEAQGIQYDVASCDGDTAKQIAQIENYIQMGISCLIVVPSNADSLSAVLKTARENGVRVVVFGMAPTDDLETYDVALATDQFQIGRSSAELAAAWVENTFPDAQDGSVETILLEVPSDPDSIARDNGLREIEKLCPKVKIVESYQLEGFATDAKVQEFMDMAFSTHPDMKLVLAHFQAFATAADESVMRNSSIDKTMFGIFTCDFNAETARRLKLSVINESVIRGTMIYAVDTVGEIMAAVNNELELDEMKFYYSPFEKVTLDNVDKFLLILTGGN